VEEVGLDRARRDAEGRSNSRLGLAGGNQFENACFGRGEVIEQRQRIPIRMRGLVARVEEADQAVGPGEGMEVDETTRADRPRRRVAGDRRRADAARPRIAGAIAAVSREVERFLLIPWWSNSVRRFYRRLRLRP